MLWIGIDVGGTFIGVAYDDAARGFTYAKAPSIRPRRARRCWRCFATLPKRPDIAVAVCFLHSYANPEHERMAPHAVRTRRPAAFVCASSDVLAQYREVPPFGTTVLNAYLDPPMNRYLDALSGALRGRDYQREVFIMTSAGGVSTVGWVARLPLRSTETFIPAINVRI